AAISATQRPLRWSRSIREAVEPVLPVIGKRSGMPAVRLRKPADITAVQPHREYAASARIVLVRCEVHRVLIHRLHRKNLVISLIELPLQFGIGIQRILLIEAVEIEMSMPIAPA